MIFPYIIVGLLLLAGVWWVWSDLIKGEQLASDKEITTFVIIGGVLMLALIVQIYSGVPL
jgi:hypothetical protein